MDPVVRSAAQQARIAAPKHISLQDLAEDREEPVDETESALAPKDGDADANSQHEPTPAEVQFMQASSSTLRDPASQASTRVGEKKRKSTNSQHAPAKKSRDMR